MKTRKLTIAATVLMMLFSLFTMPVQANDAQNSLSDENTIYADEIDAADEQSGEIDLVAGSLVISDTGFCQGAADTETPYQGKYTVYQTDNDKISNHITVKSGEIDLTISNLNVEAAKAPVLRILEGAKVNLTVDGSNQLKGGRGYAAISVAAAWTGPDNTYSPKDSGHVVISGNGTLHAVGGDGIIETSAGSEKIYIGGGAGIGGDGFGNGNEGGGDFGVVEIAGGTIQAVGGQRVGGASVRANYGAGAGIGGGGVGGPYYWSYAGTILISGGQITATGNGDRNGGSPGIGCGATASDNDSDGNDLSVEISGGTVKAYGGDNAAGIGAGNSGTSGSITISGGNVEAYGNSDGDGECWGGAGIGTGDTTGGIGKKIAITGDAQVYAVAGGSAAGIGGGNRSYVEDITISGNANVIAVGGTADKLSWGGAGIGTGNYSGFNDTPPDIKITLNTKGRIIAYGGVYSQAIGLGYSGSKAKYLYPVSIGEDTGEIWMFNYDQTQSAISGISTDNEIQSDRFTFAQQHMLFWHNGVNEDVFGNAYFWKGSQAPDNALYQWADENNKLTIKQADSEVASYLYDGNLHNAHDNWALILKEAPQPLFGNLTVSHTITGTSVDSDKEFHFTVKLSDPSVSGTYGDFSFSGGEAAFTLKHGEQKTAEKLPADITYEITASQQDQDDYTITATNHQGTITADTTITAAFTAEKITEYGSLSVSHQVIGALADTDRPFTYTVTLDDASVDGVYGDMTFVEGVAIFTLKHGEQKSAPQLPIGTAYTISASLEDQADYTITAINHQGTITANTTAAATFTADKKTEYGSLSVSHQVIGALADTDRPFTYTVTLDDASVDGVYGDMTFVEGVAIFTLKHGEQKTAPQLPIGTAYTISASLEDQADYTITAINHQGTITANTTAAAVFTADKKEEQPKQEYGSLAVTHMSADGLLDSERVFYFTVTLGDPTINGIYGDMLFKDGAAVFTLRHGETKTAVNLPVGITYRVSVKKVNGYRSNSVNAEGIIEADKLAAVTITNQKDINNSTEIIDMQPKDPNTEQTPQTGDETNIMIWLTLGMISACSIGLLRNKKINGNI